MPHATESRGFNASRKLLSGLFWVLLLNVLIKPFWILGIEVGVQNAVGAAEYGFYIDIFNLAYIFNILLDVGVTNFNTRNIAQHPQLITKHFSGLLSIKALLLGLYMAVTFTVGLLKGYASREFLLLALLSFNQFLNSLILYLRSNFEGLMLFRWDSVISILDRAVMILICGGLLWLPGHAAFRIEYLAYAQTAAYLVTALAALAVLAPHVRPLRLRFDRPFAIAILRQSLPFALLVLLMASYNRIDPMLLKDLASNGTGTFEAGIYSGAFRLLDALTMVAYLVSVPLLPVFSRLCKEAEKARAAKGELAATTRMVFSLMMVFAITASVTCSSLSDWLMQLLYRDHAEQYARVFRVLIYGLIPISVTYVFGTLLTASGKLRQLNLLAAITLCVNIAANLLLIPRLGAVGSAWASLAAQSFMGAAQLVLALRIFNMRPTWGYILKLAFFTLTIVSVNLGTAVWGIRLATVAITALAMALLLRLIDPSEIKSILKN